MHGDCEKILFTERRLRLRTAAVAAALDRDYAGKRPLVVGILKGSIIFYADLIRRLAIPVELDFMVASSYGSGTESSGELNVKKDLDGDVSGKDVIIVDDIIDSGLTLVKLKALLTERGAASVKTVTLLNKPSRREYDIEPDYNCFTIEDEFVVGYGLDYNETYRSLPYIAVLKRDVYEKKR